MLMKRLTDIDHIVSGRGKGKKNQMIDQKLLFWTSAKLVCNKTDHFLTRKSKHAETASLATHDAVRFFSLNGALGYRLDCLRVALTQPLHQAVLGWTGNARDRRSNTMVRRRIWRQWLVYHKMRLLGTTELSTAIRRLRRAKLEDRSRRIFKLYHFVSGMSCSCPLTFHPVFASQVVGSDHGRICVVGGRPKRTPHFLA